MGGGAKATRSAASSVDDSFSSSDEAIEKLITKVCANFANQLEQKIEKKFDKFEEKLNDVSKSIKALDDKINNNSEFCDSLKMKLEHTEQFLKKNSLRFYGLAEHEKEDTLNTVISFINSKLNIVCNVQDIDSAFRAGKLVSNKSRCILVNFVSNVKRNEVFGVRKLLKNSQFSIFEDLTPQRYELLMSARKKIGKNKVWSAGGKIFAWSDRDGKKIGINSISDI